MKDGVIADFTYTEKMLQYFIVKFIAIDSCVQVRGSWCACRSAQLTSSVAPSGSPPRVPAREVSISCPNPWRPRSAQACQAGKREARWWSTSAAAPPEVAVVFSERHCLRGQRGLGGDKFDEAITQYVRRNYGILIGEPPPNASRLKSHRLSRRASARASGHGAKPVRGNSTRLHAQLE